MPIDSGEVRWIGEGLPDMQVAIVPRDDVAFTDGWYVQGLKGTGSYDYDAVDEFVPQYRTFPLFAREPHRGTSPATRMGLMPSPPPVTHRGRSGSPKACSTMWRSWRPRSSG